MADVSQILNQPRATHEQHDPEQHAQRSVLDASEFIVLLLCQIVEMTITSDDYRDP